MDAPTENVISAHEVDPHELESFFAEMFPGRATAHIWPWLNRSEFFGQRTPLALVSEGRVLAFSGMIPFRAWLGSDELVAAWFIDFAVRPELQRRGLGSALTPRWASFPDAGLGFPNALSIGTARKVGWLEDSSVRMMFFPLRPFDHPRLSRRIPSFLRGLLNSSSSTWYTRRYRKHSTGASQSIRPLENDDLQTLSDASAGPAEGYFTPIRDLDYLTWRLFDSPDRDAYRIIRSGDACGVLKLRSKGDARAVDLLLVEGAKTAEDEIRLISDVALWAAKERCAFIRQLSCDADRAARVREALAPTSKPRPLVFQSPNRELTARMQDSRWRWQLIDSDFERFAPPG